jgi:hypothetical protein
VRRVRSGLPRPDPASHAIKGVALADAIRHLRPDWIYLELLTQDHYPPVQHVLEATCFLLFGYGVEIASMPSTLALILLGAGMILLCFRRAGPERWIGALACTLLLVHSAEVLAYGAISMLEIFAAALFVWGFIVYDRAVRRGDDDPAWWGVGWWTTLFVLTSSNFALFWIVGLTIHEWMRVGRDRRRAALGWARSTFCTTSFWTRPTTILASVTFLLGAWIFLFGGWTWHLGERKISVTRPGGPLYFTFFLIAARFLWWYRSHRETFRQSVPHRIQVAIWSIGLPCFLYFFVVYPPRFRNFLDWLGGRSAVNELPASEYWLFYPRALAYEYHTALWVALAVGIGFTLALLLFRQQNDTTRFCTVVTLVGLLAVNTHHGRYVRFILPVVPLIWLGAAWTLQEGIRMLPPSSAWLLRGLGLAGVATVLLTGSFLPVYAEGIHKRFDEHLMHPELTEMRIWTADRLDPFEKISIWGQLSGGLSHHMWQWEFRRRNQWYDRDIQFDLPVKWGDLMNQPLEAIHPPFDAYIAAQEYEVIVTIQGIEGTSPYDWRRNPFSLSVNEKKNEIINRMNDQDSYFLGFEKLFPKNQVWIRIWIRDR